MLGGYSMNSNDLSVLAKKTEMYAMVISIEEDFISNFKEKLELSDIPQLIVDKSKKVNNEENEFLSILRGLDIQSFIEICNSNIIKLSLNHSEHTFLNNYLTKIITIRNAVMHPRPIGFFDYPTLREVFYKIDKELSSFCWNNVTKTKHIIENNPEDLLPPPETLKKNDRIIENLPSLLDYEETSFVGRAKEIGEIKAKLNKKNVHVLSIIGDGGVGKTALTLKLLYDFLDDENCPYELIIWSSLKTNELSDDNFVEIADSIKTTAEMYDRLATFVDAKNTEDVKSLIIELAQSFNTLFVLDNLETINTADIKGFIDDFTEYGKVLITSRIGLGEMEHRYVLSGLNDTDVLEYVNRLLELYGFGFLYTDSQKVKIFIDTLYSNPLAIKWFVKCLYNGQKEEEILDHKSDVINFCMSNVYDKLTHNAHTVLNVLTILGAELSFPELMFYIQDTIPDCTDVKYAINELGKCNFIDERKFKQDNNVAVTDFAHEFLALRSLSTTDLRKRIHERKRKLSSFEQNLQIKKNDSPLDIGSIRYSNKAELISAYYLRQALDNKSQCKGVHSDNTFEHIKFAQELVPQYYETNLIAAFSYGMQTPLKAEEEYQQALKHAKSNNSKFRVLNHYVEFLIRSNEYSKAIEYLDLADELNVNHTEVIFQKAKVYSYLYKFEDADLLLNELNPKELSSTDFNKLQTRRADIYCRRSETIDIRETQKRLIFFKMAVECLTICPEPDKKVYEYMSKVLCRLSYMYGDEDVLDFILNLVQKYYPKINKTEHYNEFTTQINERLPQIKNIIFKKSISRYIINYNNHLNVLKPNEAVIYNLKEGYGFCKNNEFLEGLYFSMRGLPANIMYGDILSYSSVLDSQGKYSVVAPKLIDNIFDRIQQTL